MFSWLKINNANLILNLGTLVVFSGVSLANAQAQTAGIDELKRQSFDQLAQIFDEGDGTEIPDGDSVGLMLFIEKFPLIDKLYHHFWKGKFFDRANGTLYNKVLGKKSDFATVYVGYIADRLDLPSNTIRPVLPGRPSFKIDGRKSIIIDYANSPQKRSRPLVDELRQVWVHRYPSLYLGRATWKGKSAAWFILDFDQKSQKE